MKRSGSQKSDKGSVDKIRMARDKSPAASRRGKPGSYQRAERAESGPTLKIPRTPEAGTDSDPGTPPPGRVGRAGRVDTDGDYDDDDDDGEEDVLVALHTVPAAEMVDPHIATPKNFKEYCDPAKYTDLKKKEKSRQEALYELIRTEGEYTW